MATINLPFGAGDAIAGVQREFMEALRREIGDQNEEQVNLSAVE